MKTFNVITVIILTVSISFCVADKHIYKTFLHRSSKIYHEAVLIDSITSEPKSYTIIFKYFGSFLKPVTKIEFDVNSPSTGIIHAISGNQKHPYFDFTLPVAHYFAKITINDTTNVTATMKMYGSNSSKYLDMEATKSMTIIHSKSARSAQRPFGTSMGMRLKGDELIHFKSRNVTNASRFPSRSFEYSGTDYITYVAFSFSSPTAMALINGTYIGEREFNSVVYDLNSEHFVANISIYGIKNAGKSPEDREGLISFL
ncbi:uncharacterized protein LOC119074419 [Bradysia coprophila]|uniref:uncharacterized protein LOC119074419 n=1 Tax=Bradysia coprophila TaxID=38358 RepID=UPI00187D8119|nr:uncharacterized protein LOC119074419 [Bradysia coprophila]